MIDALRYEWVRLRTLRSTWWLTGAALLLSVAVAVVIAIVADSIDTRLAGVALTGGTAFSPLPFVAVFVGLVGAFAFGHEYRHGTILPTLTAVPRRGQLVVAKALTVAVWGLATTVVSIGLNWVAASAISGHGLPLTEDPIGPALVAYLAYDVIWSLLGLGLAAVLRSLPATVVVLLVVPLLVEPLLSGLVLIPALESVRPAINYLPFTAGVAPVQTFDVGQLSGRASPYGDPPAAIVSSLTFAAWMAAVFASGWALFVKRDA